MAEHSVADILPAEQERQAFLLRLSDALRSLTDPAEVTQTAMTLIGEHLRVSRALYFEVDRTRADVERTRAEAALRDSEHKYRMLFDSIDEGFCIVELLVDRDGRAFDYRFVETNPAFVKHTGLHDAAGRTILELAPSHERFWFDTYDEIARSGIARRFERRAEALGRWYDVYAFRIGAADERRVAVLFSDISDRKCAEAALRQSEERARQLNEQLEQRVRERTAQIHGLFARLVRAQEDERSRIARDMHDQLGQQMTALRMSLEVLTSRASRNDVLATHAARTQRLAEELDRSVDFLMWDLRPAALDHLGLAAALEKLVREWSERFNIVAEFDAGGTASIRLMHDAEVNVYRLAQEALHNVVKHADATHVSVVLQRVDGDILLVIEDNGRGFSVEDTPRRSGLGLVSMRERAALIGGTLEIESEPRRGTTVFARVPISAPVADPP